MLSFLRLENSDGSFIPYVIVILIISHMIIQDVPRGKINTLENSIGRSKRKVHMNIPIPNDFWNKAV